MRHKWGYIFCPSTPFLPGRPQSPRAVTPSALVSFTSLSQIPNIAIEEGRVHFGSAFAGTLHCSREDMAVGAQLVASHPHPWPGSRERDACA